MFNINYNQNGFAAFYITVLVLAVIFAIAVSAYILIYGEQKISTNIVKSSQSYYIAEAGLEDILLKLVKGLDWSTPYVLDTGNGTAQIQVSDISGGARTLTSTGNSLNRIRKIKAVYEISVQEIEFFYGAQIGEGGLRMANNSRVKGNVYSNGSATATGGGWNAVIDDSIVVALNGNRIEGLDIGEDAKVYSCIDSTIDNDLTYVTGGTLDNCSVDGYITEQSEEIEAQDLPITQENIDQWKQEAEAGEIIEGDYILQILRSDSLGPAKVNGNMVIKNLSFLNLTGTVWVTGDLTLKNLSMIRLDPGYGSKSGVMVFDGKITVENGTWLAGSGTEGSYIMLLSTNDSLQESDPAIHIGNVSIGDSIFYAGNGLIRLGNGVSVKQLTAYEILLDNNSEIDYESGLQDTFFSSGPGASWQITSWKETE